MKKYTNFLILLLLALAVVWPSTAYASEPQRAWHNDKVVFGGTYTLESGQTLDGNLIIFGGTATTEEGSIVNGDVALFGGYAKINGLINGNLVGIGGVVQLTSTAIVNGDLVTIGATLSRDEGAQVRGQIVSGVGAPFTLDIPTQPGNSELTEIPSLPVAPQAPGINVSFNPLIDMLWFFFRTFMWALLAVLVVIFFVNPTERVAKAAFSQPLITGSAGLITAILTPFALIALTLTIILIPVTLIAALLLLVAWMFGWIALGLEVGRRIAKLFNAEWAPAISAGVGTFILFLILGGFNQLIPCVGWIPQVLVGIWGLGAVVMTRFGSQEYSPVSSSGGTSPAAGTDAPAAALPQPVQDIEPETIMAPLSENFPGPEEPAAPPSGE